MHVWYLTLHLVAVSLTLNGDADRFTVPINEAANWSSLWHLCMDMEYLEQPPDYYDEVDDYYDEVDDESGGDDDDDMPNLIVSLVSSCVHVLILITEKTLCLELNKF